uniref:Uncharacterized protein n=1 Tax=Arundo donax TaxID=35708 RepID=A0A0A8Y731_ARUDO
MSKEAHPSISYFHTMHKFKRH